MFALDTAALNLAVSSSRLFNNTANSDPSCDLVDGTIGGAQQFNVSGGRCNLTSDVLHRGLRLTRVTEEPEGANCTYGGRKIDNGYDSNGDDTLSDAEIRGDSLGECEAMRDCQRDCRWGPSA